MTGMAAIAFCAAFTSCSKDENLYNENQIRQNEASQIVEEYNKAFIAAFGQPAADQTWGFKGYAGTRSENANANEWADPDKEYGGLLVPPAITDKQAAVVKEYFQTHRNLGYTDPGWTNYFIQQVYKGYTDPKTGTDPNTNKPYSPEKYLAADGGTWIYASNNMDHLAAINGTFVDHINNFNHGDCSPNGDVLDNGQHVGGTHHTDKIMYMKNSTTASFGYYNSNGSVRRTEYTGLVGWKTIHDWAVTNYPGYDGCLNDDWNRSYMGFDFEQMVGPEIQAQELDYSVQYNTELYGPDGFPSKGPKWYEFKGQKYIMLSSNQNMYCGTPYKKANGEDLNDSDMTDEFIESLLADGYLPVDGGANKKWVKVGGCADGYFSDWIVTLTEAKTGETPDPSVVRIIAEDLSISSDPTNLKGDFDFNDVVFDVTFNDDKSVATIQLVAAGGVLPLTVAGVEVHRAFGQQGPDPVTGWYKMVNTGGISEINGATAASFTYDNPGENGINIPVMVNKFTKNADGTFTDNWIELTAMQGQCPAKLCVNQTFEYCSEREPIDQKYTGFQSWVQGNKYIWW